MADRPVKTWLSKVYYNSGGAGSAETYTEIPQAKSIAMTAPREADDATTKGAGAYKQYDPGQFDISLSFSILSLKDSSTGAINTVESALRTAYTAGSTLGWAVKDGSISTTGTAGWEFDGFVAEYNEQKPDDTGNVMIDIVVKPAYSATAPAWRVES